MELIDAGHEVLRKLNEAGYVAYFVGGMVRDRLLGREIYDIDITTAARPEQVQSLFERTYATGIAHGTITVIIEKIPVEVTTFRIESDYQDFRHPNQVVFTSSLVEDLQRRDFTINAIAQNIEGDILDPIRGLEDLKSKTLKAVGNAEVRFREDPLRILRGIRFVSKLGFRLDEEAYQAIKSQRQLMKHLAKERVKKELEGLMTGIYKEKAIQLIFETEIFEVFEVFKPLTKYKEYSFKSLVKGLDFFVLVGLEVEDIQKFVTEWPFSKKEKKMIQFIKTLINEPLQDAQIQYLYGIETRELYYRIRCFLEQETLSFKSIELPIKGRKDLDIKVSELIDAAGKPSGPWTGQMLAKIELKVILGELKNEKSEILEFVRMSV